MIDLDKSKNLLQRLTDACTLLERLKVYRKRLDECEGTIAIDTMTVPPIKIGIDPVMLRPGVKQEIANMEVEILRLRQALIEVVNKPDCESCGDVRLNSVGDACPDCT